MKRTPGPAVGDRKIARAHSATEVEKTIFDVVRTCRRERSSGCSSPRLVQRTIDVPKFPTDPNGDVSHCRQVAIPSRETVVLARRPRAATKVANSLDCAESLADASEKLYQQECAKVVIASEGPRAQVLDVAVRILGQKILCALEALRPTAELSDGGSIDIFAGEAALALKIPEHLVVLHAVLDTVGIEQLP